MLVPPLELDEPPFDAYEWPFVESPFDESLLVSDEYDEWLSGEDSSDASVDALSLTDSLDELELP